MSTLLSSLLYSRFAVEGDYIKYLNRPIFKTWFRLNFYSPEKRVSYQVIRFTLSSKDKCHDVFKKSLDRAMIFINN